MRRFLTTLAIAAGLLVGFVWHAPVAHAADCDSNAIMRCGFEGGSPHATNQNFIDKVKQNAPGDLVNIYKAYGLEPSQYDTFATYARQGRTYKDGRLVVDGRTVGTSANSIGRLSSYQGSNPFSKRIAGVTYWGNTNDKAFIPDSLPVTVMFDNAGDALFAVINSCGNPVGFTPSNPTYACNKLTATEVSGQPGTYTFKTSASAGNGASIDHIVYDYGDGVTEVSNDVNRVMTHRYTSSKSFHASVKIYLNLPYGHTKVIDGLTTGCDKVITVQLPVYACLLLQALPIPDKQFTYQIIVKSSTQFGASLGGATINFGDGSKSVFVRQANLNTVSTTHVYKPGAWKASATLLIYLPNNQSATVTSAKCATPVKVGDFGCAQLTGEQTDVTNNPLVYRFTAAGNATKNVVVFKTADFDFGDGSKTNGVTAVNQLAVADHTFAADGDYTITAVLHFTDNGVAKDDTCTTNITKQPTQECSPGVPQGSPMCNPCTTNPQVPADSDQCTTVLPNTGAGDVIAIAGVTALIGFFLYRQFIFRKHVFHSDNGTVNLLLGETTKQHHAIKHEMATHNAHHRNKQGLHHQANYHRPHRFRPRSHGDR